MFSSFSQAGNGIKTGFRVAQGIQGNMDATFAKVGDLCGKVISAAGVQGMRGPKFLSELQGVFPDIDGYDLRPKGACDHYGGEAHTPAAVNRKNLPASYLALVCNSPEGGNKTAPQGSGRHAVNRLGQFYQVYIRIVDRHKFRKRAPMGKSWLGLVITYLVVS
jgi:hypothetical protein